MASANTQSGCDVSWQPRHNSLSLFDLNRVKSRIPVFVHKHHKETVKASDNTSLPHTTLSTLPASGNSRIPVCQDHLQHSSHAHIPQMASIQEKQEGKRTRRQGKLPFDKPGNIDAKSRKTIKLRGLELATINFEIFEHSDVEALYLSPEREACLDYKLPFLPSSVGKLTKLRTLVLDTNELEEIPEEISNLRQLEILVLSNNNLVNLPHGVASLLELKSLHLANNSFEHMPLMICQLQRLGFLDMSDNHLRALPIEIADLSASLHTLILLMNEIEQLPPSFSMMTSLTCLWLGDNRLTALPEDFGELFRLDWGARPCSSNIERNPLVHPPVEICQQGPFAIRKYFHNLNAGTTIQTENIQQDTKIFPKASVANSKPFKGRAVK